ncbi:hypothetical protein [Photobacterium phosphoreum]|uniref:hypothetical protein n=1 Tax=Photobacterium phosphoreum TaxID=659 RepID=UPI000D1831F3|nr:hypothetical protein [Photobacterium phosphoreum]MCD9478428.1 hypothetical protein [Photobacterium phosphoreum]MCD9483426.1 hypothetical protein [Photobacterium phosphoreum]PSU39316.1 hypothetical protein CTM85_06785 [Photobacterium phosphoreum]
MKRIAFFLLIITHQVSASDCNVLEIDESKSVNGRYKYCFNSDYDMNKLVNLSSSDITIIFNDNTSSVIYPFEYIYVPKKFKFQINEKIQKFINRFDIDTFVFRNPKPKRIKRAASAAVLLRLGTAGAAIGAMGTVATAPNKSPTAKQLASGAVGGFIGGAATPALGNLAGPALGIAAAGACMEACHLN